MTKKLDSHIYHVPSLYMRECWASSLLYAAICAGAFFLQDGPEKKLPACSSVQRLHERVRPELNRLFSSCLSGRQTEGGKASGKRCDVSRDCAGSSEVAGATQIQCRPGWVEHNSLAAVGNLVDDARDSIYSIWNIRRSSSPH